jgi:hypothetical protein
MLRSVGRQFPTFRQQPIGPIFKGQAVKEKSLTIHLLRVTSQKSGDLTSTAEKPDIANIFLSDQYHLSLPAAIPTRRKAGNGLYDNLFDRK